MYLKPEAVHCTLLLASHSHNNNLIAISTTICGNDFTQHIPLHIPLCLLANRVCGNDFTQHILLRKPRRSQNKLKPIPDYHPG